MATSCFATDIQATIPDGEVLPLMKWFRRKDNGMSREDDGGTFSSKNNIYDSPSYNDDLLKSLSEGVDGLKETQRPGDLLVKPKFQRMEEFADLQGIKQGPKKITGGNGDLEEFGLWQPANPNYGDYSGDFDWSTEEAKEESLFSDFKDGSWTWETGSDKRNVVPLEIDGYWFYPLKEDGRMDTEDLEADYPAEFKVEDFLSPNNKEWQIQPKEEVKV
ncbi:uncharacterized protein LOC144446428 [Glandiceps talaboti]